MTENGDHRLVSRDYDDGSRYIAIVRRDPETDQLTDDQIITGLKQWQAKRKQTNRERWPMPQPFGEWIEATEPGPSEPCPDCGCFSLRLAAPPDQPAADAKVVCTMVRCVASPFYRD
ncbi:MULTISPECIES: hypothetical protein [unclassified Streptomyces]|uniref:hypothetical protein n=1 Tax=unclassified Streptomyces TaxID=2593676 RepID=UPI0004C9078C|nr:MULTISPECIES: hypothetical protein [unclassified Streptomyces]KOV86084.1 hypothetical protein ADL02_19530 [Streptomyces sp. NRRL WC-3723]